MLFRDSNKGIEENATYVPNDAVALFNSMLDNAETANWYAGAGSGRVPDSSAACSSTPASVFNNFDNHQVSNYFMPQNPIPNNPFELGFENWQFDTGLDNEVRALNEFGGQTEMGNFNLSPNSSEFAVQLSQGRLEIGELGFGEVSIPSPLLINRSKLLNNVSQPTLFQKRAALRKNIENINGSNMVHFIEGNDVKNEEIGARKRKSNLVDDPDYGNDDDLDEQVLRTGGGNLNMEESGKNGESSSPGNSTVTGDGGKGKKKAHPAKNLLAERRRRKKLNDRLYMLRSVVPKITKMDRASILGDAIEYLKELSQKINDLNAELDSSPSGSTITSSSCFHPITSKAFGLPMRIKEELSPHTCLSFQSTATGQPARIEVRLKDNRAVSIHMFCGLRPGILSSTLRTLDALGLDIEHATISCFNGFTFDVFQAQKCNGSEELNPEDIKAALLDSAGCHGII